MGDTIEGAPPARPKKVLVRTIECYLRKSLAVTKDVAPEKKDALVERISKTSLLWRKRMGDDTTTRVPKAYRKVQGLRVCPNCDKYLNRDINGSISIGKVWRSVHVEGQGIPKTFDRKYCIVMMKRKC
eukprot:CAMPEP_0175057390 /NCGR_PEP_ID=MMETSP0052_2-20121109/11237_1 /TAXON_ID=51329 ORGANISM="Polytomella parva, Strain SAG 63-3" /NCGR_SAMPLE_ID=MMETSP0052_2 /ASSEMBLY_ACC=CAM_ASM_000194 /LENGTH=127 /DNA_ID=CAMNT_0016322597 /DNA_START=220 /DNA_END=603 /DNA_ORIENTATION=-